MISKAHGFILSSLAAIAGSQMIGAVPIAAQTIVVRALPRIGADAVVAPCGDRALVLSERALVSLSSNGIATPIGQVTKPLGIFSGRGSCRVIDASLGVVDVTEPPSSSNVQAVGGTLADVLTSAVQASDGSAWFGVEGSDELGTIDRSGTVRYFGFPEDDSSSGRLMPTQLHVAPTTSANPILTRDVQLISASSNYVWALRVSTPLNATAYALRFDPVTLAYQRLSLGAIGRFAGLAALDDGRAVVLTLGDRILMIDPSRIKMQWVLPGKPLYHAPPFRLNMITSAGSDIYASAVKDGSIWHLSTNSTMLDYKGVFPARPSWIYSQLGRLVGIDTDGSQFMSIPI